ncbi:MAG: tRNA pseudouridine(38-40) synthase TruA [Pseudomonadota bacterium]
MPRACLCVEYDGTGYHGWQYQHHSRSVQQVLQTALAKVLNHTVEVVCAGRTDTGVHASGQIVHFDSPSDRTERGLVLGTNANLPMDVSVRWARLVVPEFHARFDAVERRYRYLILESRARSALYAARAWCQSDTLDTAAMQHAADMLIGEHDFSTFRAAGCQAKHAVRSVRQLRVVRCDHWIVVDIAANAFLQHMVRNIVGYLWHVGSGRSDADRTPELLAARDRTKAPVAAPACGLYLTEVRYPEHFDLPQLHAEEEQLLPLSPLIPLIA